MGQPPIKDTQVFHLWGTKITHIVTIKWMLYRFEYRSMLKHPQFAQGYTISFFPQVSYNVTCCMQDLDLIYSWGIVIAKIYHTVYMYGNSYYIIGSRISNNGNFLRRTWTNEITLKLIHLDPQESRLSHSILSSWMLTGSNMGTFLLNEQSKPSWKQ